MADLFNVFNIYFPVPEGPVACPEEEGQAATKASKTKLEDHTISLTGLVMNKTEQNSG